MASQRRRWAAVAASVVLVGTAWAAAPAAMAGAAPASSSAAGGPPTATVPACPAASWPMYQHDVSHTAVADPCPRSAITRSNASTLASRWFVPTNAAVTATPAVVGGQAYVGDASGIFRAMNAATGAVQWTFNDLSNSVHNDRHQPSFGEFPSSPAVANVAGVGETVFVGGGGTLYALDAATGAPRWAQDVDPGQPTSAIEIESSPVVDFATSPPEVIVGSDDNGSPNIDVTGIQAFNAATGALLWKYEPESDQVVHSLTGQDGSGDACGDVWSSPALDHGLVLFGTGNCADQTAAIAHHDFATNSGVFALNAVSGARQWAFFELPNQYDTGQPSDAATGDDDFGSSAVVVHNVAGRTLVVEGSKSGYVYALDESNGQLAWKDEPAQAGQLSPQLVGSVGGFIGSPALGRADGAPALFLASAVPLPLAGSGVDPTASPPVTPDSSLASDPTRMVSLHAVDVATGKVLWQDAVSAPTYAAVTYDNGVVFVPSTTGLAAAAYNADTGSPLWAFPLAAAPSSGASIVGPDIYLGAGTAFGQGGPPQADGIWSFGAR